jgi:hypothetical protein
MFVERLDRRMQKNRCVFSVKAKTKASGAIMRRKADLVLCELNLCVLQEYEGRHLGATGCWEYCRSVPLLEVRPFEVCQVTMKGLMKMLKS